MTAGGRAGGRAVPEPYYSQRSRSVCVSLSAFFILWLFWLYAGHVKFRIAVSFLSRCLAVLSFLFSCIFPISIVRNRPCQLSSVSTTTMKKRSERRKHCAPAVVPPQTHRVRDGCSKAEPKFSPAADRLHGGAGPPKFSQLEIVTTCTYRPSLVKIDARNFELSW